MEQWWDIFLHAWANQKKPCQFKKKKKELCKLQLTKTNRSVFYFLLSLLTLSIISSVILCSTQTHAIKAHDGHPPLSSSTLVEPMSLGIEFCRSILPLTWPTLLWPTTWPSQQTQVLQPKQDIHSWSKEIHGIEEGKRWGMSDNLDAVKRLLCLFFLHGFDLDFNWCGLFGLVQVCKRWHIIFPLAI